MISRNRFGNATNPYQTTAKKVLTVCSAGLLRSPTLAKTLGEEYGYNCRAAGISEDFALIVVDELLVYWADEIVFVEPSVKQQFDLRFPDYQDTVKVLNIPDNYGWGDEDLVRIMKEQYAETLTAA